MHAKRMMDGRINVDLVKSKRTPVCNLSLAYLRCNLHLWLLVCDENKTSGRVCTSRVLVKLISQQKSIL